QLIFALNTDFDLNGHNQQLSLLTNSGFITNQNTTPAVLTLTPSALTPDLVSASLQGNLSLNLPNPCNVTLSSGTNIYTGNTTVASANATLTSGVTNALPITTSLSL